jgi:hypothetical protein
MQFSEKDAQSIISTFGTWANGPTNIRKLLETEKTVLNEDERKSKQLELLRSIDPEWQDVLEKSTSFSLERIVDLEVMNTPLSHYKALYEREYSALKFMLDREAFKMNKDKQGSLLKANTALEHGETSLGDAKKGIRHRLRRLLFEN